jgi:ADP-ribose pyrophosphatase YjhB (NUDIX family)
MAKICDHTSVGMVVIRDGKILLNERMKYPFGYAPAAGHVDAHETGDESYEASAVRELWEEVGLTAVSLELVYEGRKENRCRREGGSWHYWKVYRVEVEGEVNRSLDETKNVGWYDIEEINALAGKTTDYLNGEISEEEWQAHPGLETVWYDFLMRGEVDLFSMLDE